jgi:hypothetical protein
MRAINPLITKNLLRSLTEMIAGAIYDTVIHDTVIHDTVIQDIVESLHRLHGNVPISLLRPFALQRTPKHRG